MLIKVYLVKAMVFPVVMYWCESWAIKKAESQRIDDFNWQYWRKLLRIPWTARRSNQLNIKEINTEYSLEELMLMLKLCYFVHLMGRADWLKEALMLGMIEGRRRRGRQRMRWLASPTQWKWVWESPGRWWTAKPGVLKSMGFRRIRNDWVAKQQQQQESNKIGKKTWKM